MLIRRRVVRKCLTSYPDPAASVGVSAGAKPSLLGLQAALTLQPFHSLSVKPSSGSSLGKPRSSFVQEPSCNHMQLLGWDLPVNLVFRTLFFFKCSGTEPGLGGWLSQNAAQGWHSQGQGPLDQDVLALRLPPPLRFSDF